MSGANGGGGGGGALSERGALLRNSAVRSAIELRLGRWQDALADVPIVDCLLCDAPYGAKTHEAYSPRTSVLTACERDARWAAKGGKRRTIDYAAWDPAEVTAFVDAWAPRVRGWFCAFTSHDLAEAYATALEHAGRYVFAPIACVEPGSRVRLAGDGPSQWSTWLIVARPRAVPYSKWGTLPGAYVVPGGHSGQKTKFTGAKPPWLMRALVRDYSRPGDLIVDPCAGSATTLIAAAIEGRRAIGAELDLKTYALAQKRIARGHTPDLFTHHAEREPAEQTKLVLDGK